MIAPEPGQTLLAIFDEKLALRGDAPCLWEKKNGAWRSLSWRQVADSIERLARCLVDCGVGPGDRVALVAENRPEWFIADHAIMAAGAVSVPAYTTYMPDDFRYLLEHSGAVAVIGGGASINRRLRPALVGNGNLRLLVGLDGMADVPSPGLPMLSFDQALEAGKGGARVTAGRERSADDVACFIYTSGTGGRPRAVMLSHANIVANIRGAWNLLEEVGIGDDVFLSFLPLSHAYEHTAGQFLPVAMGAQIYYAEGVDKLAANLAEVRPTIVTCVPRLFEVLRQRIQAGIVREAGLKAKLFAKALDLGAKRLRQERLGPVDRIADLVLDRLVRRKVQERFGGRLKAMVSGGAPLNDEVAEFFLALGIPLLQGYGQTEASPVISVNRPKRNRLGTVGPPFAGLDLRLDEEGEILVRGSSVMRGYWRDPDATAKVLRDGWLHTGDIGVVEDDGYLRITDRKKDIIVNSGGDNVAPQRVEGILLLQPEIAQAVVYGDRRPHLVALLVPSAELLKLAKDAQTGALDSAMADAVRRANQKLTSIERVRRYLLLDEGFTVDNGMMTPTLKLKRAAIIEKFKKSLDGMYASNK